MNAQLVEDLRATRDHVDTYGWCQGHLEDERGQVCLMGAAQAAIAVMIDGNHARYRRIENFLDEGIAQTLGMTVEQLCYGNVGNPNQLTPIAYYNDHKLQSKQEVLDFLDKQVLRAEERA